MASRPESDIAKRLADRDWRTRRAAALELGYSRDPAYYGTLLPLLDDHDPAVRQAAILSLGRLGAPELVAELSKPKVLADEDAEVRRVAVSVLGQLGGFPIVEVISDALLDPDWTVRSEAIAAVSRLVDRFTEFRIPEAARGLVRLLAITDRDVRERTITALGGFGKAGVHVLLEALDVRSELIRSGAAAALGLVRDPTTAQRLVELLDDDSRQVRLAAITALGNLRTARAIEPLVERLGDADRSVRSAAHATLVRIGHAAVVQLIEALAHAGTEVFISGILRVLGEFRDARALVPIMNHIGHTYMRVRVAAVDAAVAYGEDAVPYLLDMLVQNAVPVEDLIRDAEKNPQKRNRLRTIRALGELKDSRAVSVLKEIGQERDAEIRGAVEEALAKIGGATWARANAVKALGQIGGESAVGALIGQLKDPNSTAHSGTSGIRGPRVRWRGSSRARRTPRSGRRSRAYSERRAWSGRGSSRRASGPSPTIRGRFARAPPARLGAWRVRARRSRWSGRSATATGACGEMRRTRS
jgi:HEAT repeat protein